MDLSHYFFDLRDCLGDRFSQYPAAAGDDQDIIFDPDTAEITEFRHGVVVDIFLEFAVILPEVDQFGDEIDAGFNSHDISFAKDPSEPQGRKA